MKRYDPKCLELAVYFFGETDPRLDEIAESIQDRVEAFPEKLQDCEHHWVPAGLGDVCDKCWVHSSASIKESNAKA